MYIYKNPLTISQLSCELRTPLFKNFKKNCKIWFLKGCCEEKDRERYCVHPTHSRYIWKLPLLHPKHSSFYLPRIFVNQGRHRLEHGIHVLIAQAAILIYDQNLLSRHYIKT